MKVLVHYKRESTGALPWSAYADVPAYDENTGKPMIQRITTGSCSTKWGTTWEMKRQVRRHLRRGKRRLVDHKVVTLKCI